MRDIVKRFSWMVLIILLLGDSWSQAGAYDYPFKDPYVATIIATPTEFGPELPEKIDDELLSFKVFPERAIPDVFWYQPEFQYSLTYQKGEAPLIFVIAGTGNGFNPFGLNSSKLASSSSWLLDYGA